MVESGSQTLFRESISQAPEFTQPFKANTLFGVEYWPFQEVEAPEDASSCEKIVFEAQSKPYKETDPLLVRITYEESYGLKAKRTIVLRRFPSSELLMMSGAIQYSFDDVDIVLAAGLESPLVTEGIVADPENFKPTIAVMAKDDQIPPLAFMDYQFSAQTPLHAQFANTDYQQALKGEVEKRVKGRIYGPSYSFTYFQWENLIGAKVGIAKYDDPDDSDRLRLYRWFTKINSSSPTQLEDSPYKQKLSRSEDRMHWGEGRLRFSRMNSQTDESWMFSVPEWMDIRRFHNDIQYSPLTSFFWQYPVVFCVKNRGEERKWFSTYSRFDKARG